VRALTAGGRRKRVAAWLGEHRLVLAAGLIAALPVIVSTGHALVHDWIPVGDNASTAVRSYDVLSAHSPLVGQWSTSSAVVGEPIYSLGPLLNWLLAFPARLGNPAWLALTMGVVNAASAVLCVALAHRRGGTALMIVAAVAVAVMSHSLGGEAMHSLWNRSAALLPFTALLFVAWSAACGDYRLLPVAVLLASFVIQCHLAYVAPALGLLAIAVTGLVLARRGLPQHALRRWALVAVAVAAVAWSAPLIEQVTHSPGNLVLAKRAATADLPRFGKRVGYDAVVRAVGVRPWWLREPQGSIDRFFETLGTPSRFAEVTAILVLLGLAGVAVLATLRRRADVAWGAAIGLMCCVALASDAAATPTEGQLYQSITYTLGWGAAAGMFAWLMLGWGTVVLLAPRRLSVPRWRLAPAVGLAGAAVVAVVVAINPKPDDRERAYDSLQLIRDRLHHSLGDAERVTVVPSFGGALLYDSYTSLIYMLRSDGRLVRSPDPSVKGTFGEWYYNEDRTKPQVTIGAKPLEPGFEPVARVSPSEVLGPPPPNLITGEPGEPEPAFTVAVARH
jgi:hypothetical protein